MIIKDAPPFGLAIDAGEIVGKLKDWGFPLGLRRSPVYAINGRWEVIDRECPPWFYWIDLKVEGEQVSGKIALQHRVEDAGKSTTQLWIEGFDISGLISGNRFSFKVRDYWRSSGLHLEQVSILFTAAARGDEIRLHYQVESPPSLEDRSGQFTVRRPLHEGEPGPGKGCSTGFGG
jgi:hypothetical protein